MSRIIFPLGKTKEYEIKARNHQINFKRLRLTRWSLWTLFLLATGCNNQTLFKKVSEFDSQVNESTAVIAGYYNILNQQEIDLYLLTLELEPNCRMGNYVNYNCLKKDWNEQQARKDFQSGKLKDPCKDINQIPDSSRPIPDSNGWLCSPLERPLFSEKGIQTRLNLLKTLAEFSGSLANLAGDSSPGQFQQNIATLQARFISLETTIEPSSTGDQYSAPISNLEPIRIIWQDSIDGVK